MPKNFFEMVFDRALNSLQNHTFQIHTAQLTVTLQGKSWQKYSISEKSCFYIMTRRSEKKACRNEIFTEKLSEYQGDRNMKRFHKTIWAEKSYSQNAKDFLHKKHKI